MASEVSAQAQAVVCNEMCFYCFESLQSHLYNTPPPNKPSFTNDPYPLFVTWKIVREQHLRGCIGTFEPLPLHKGLRDYAIDSAIRDSRFDPVSKDELSQLSVAVSLLTNFEEGRNWSDWQIGVHGIRIEFIIDGRKRSATFLPEVAREAGWDHTKTIDHLLRKGGFRYTITDEVRNSIHLVRYKSEKLSVSYNEFKNWQDKK